MPCKTRQAALRGERSKPHFYLIAGRLHVALPRDYAPPRPFDVSEVWAFASTWGRSR